MRLARVAGVFECFLLLSELFVRESPDCLAVSQRARRGLAGWLAPLSSLHISYHCIWQQSTHTLGKAFVRNYPGRPVSLCLPDMPPPLPPLPLPSPPPPVIHPLPQFYAPTDSLQLLSHHPISSRISSSSLAYPSPLCLPTPLTLPQSFQATTTFPRNFFARPPTLLIYLLVTPADLLFHCSVAPTAPTTLAHAAVECRARLCHNPYPPCGFRRQPDSTPASLRCYSPKNVFKLTSLVPPPNAKSLSPNKKSSGSP
ncbi:unnamed protein product [Chondrus crispus]|uniref:Uncharacterized protein n=1 Tax=Chondrus crispus TaxID=2769 RepID=R7QQH8_CHOCR|nr:unnamed protein product [Chondrus crispus]CDF39640.1 unnamed protein product [Chondrus crispus]|eukprot:XP_005709934.1 unnamed protein product [Chondrus crispus]